MGFLRTVEVEVEAPVDRVFDYVADVLRHPEWAANPLTVEHADGPDVGVGARFRTHMSKVMPVVPKSFDGEIVVVGADRPVTFAYEAHDGGGSYRWTFRLEPHGRSSRLAHTVERLHGPLPIRVLQPLMWRAFGRGQVRRGLAGIKARLESTTAELI